ncbi:hypothetical protein IFM89_024769 [Coptis chinensis]|uniref:Uncharacterized protein n=1 Tax=Coptis chinensis TaxID=261450 RepID=A0A835HPC6_9MAGN|nr:hypothetical protein IFM89_024769 [Coptis chinensis]
MKNKVAKHESLLTRCVKPPFRILGRVRDFYVRSVTDCSGMISRASVMGGAFGPVNITPRSFSVSSLRSNNDEDLKELIRAAFQRGLREKLEMEIPQLQQLSKKSDMLPWSFTVGITEEKPELYPRSKSYVVLKKNGSKFW